MPHFAWRRRTTRHFGEQWVPYADLNLRSVSGRWRAFSVQVDSGAVVSVLKRSAADLLGINLESGESIEPAGIGGPARRYFLHTCTSMLGDSPVLDLRIAFADREEAPNLLGRLDVIDRFRIDFDPSSAETRFHLP